VEALNFSDVGAEILEMAQSLTATELKEMLQSAGVVGLPITAAQSIVEYVGGGGEPRYEGDVFRHRRIDDHSLDADGEAFITPELARRGRRPASVGISPSTQRTIRFHRRIDNHQMAYTRRHSAMAQKIQRAFRRKSNRRRGAARAHSRISTKRSALIGAAPARSSGAVTVRRTMLAPNPTTTEGGASFTSGQIRNATSETTPDGNFSFGYAFQLDQMTQYTEYTDAFQWYKIQGVILTFFPEQNTHHALPRGNATHPIDDVSTNNSATTLTGQAPYLIVAPDTTSDAIFSGVNVALAHEGAKMHMFNNADELKVSLRPKPTGLVGTAGSEVRILTSDSKWITTSSATVPHYGLRAYMSCNDHSTLRVFMTMIVSFKGLKH